MNAIWPPNFSQLIPDLIVALVTGVAVGLALDVVQRRAAGREQRKEAQRGWDRLQPRLRRLFVRPIIESLGVFPPQGDLDAIAAELADEPIRSWAALLGKQHPIGLLVELDTQIGRLLGLGETLATEVGQVTGRWRETHGVPADAQALGDMTVIALVHHEITDLPLPDRFVTARAEAAGLPEHTLLAWADEVGRDPRVKRLRSPYMTALIRVRASHQWLREHFDREDGAAATPSSTQPPGGPSGGEPS